MKSESSFIMFLKKLFIIHLFIIGISNFTSAQDIITLKTGEEIKAKVNEVELNVIKYTKFDNQTGPIYTIYKADVFMIKYENGSKDVFDYKEPTEEVQASQYKPDIQTDDVEKLTSGKGGSVMKDKQQLKPYEVKAIMNSNYTALKRYRGGRAFNTLGIVFLAIGSIDIGLGIGNAVNGYDAAGNLLAGGIEIGIGLIFRSICYNKTQSSVLIYNSGLKNKSSTSLKLGLSENGLGFCYNF